MRYPRERGKFLEGKSGFYVLGGEAPIVLFLGSSGSRWGAIVALDVAYYAGARSPGQEKCLISLSNHLKLPLAHPNIQDLVF